MTADLWLSELKGRKTYMIPILAAGLKDSTSDTNLKADRLSETEMHLPILKEEFSRYFLEKVNNLFPLVKLKER
jgi:hypothetical protein